MQLFIAEQQKEHEEIQGRRWVCTELLSLRDATNKNIKIHLFTLFTCNKSACFKALSDLAACAAAAAAAVAS